MQRIKRLISKYTGHGFVYLMDRGNSAIEAAVRCAAGDSIMIPDQGGWFSYPKIPRRLGLSIIEARTDSGLILNLVDSDTLLYANPAGYFASQDIAGIRRAFGGRIILDVSGCLGDKEMCDGKHADFLVGSFGKWKAADAGYGGFISSDRELDVPESFEKARAEEVLEAVKDAPKRLEWLYRKCAKVKEDLSDLRILHRDRKGINVVVSYRDEEEKARIRDYCSREGLDTVQCPNYIKVMRPAISIEVKRTSSGS